MTDSQNSQPDSQSDPTPPQPRPLPGQIYVRPGIDDRPDLDKALSPEDKIAVARLAVPLRRRVPEASAAQAAETQTARMSSTGSPAAAAAAVDSAIPDMTSAFLDMRDPMVAPDGTRPVKTQVRRLTWSFALAAALRTIPWVMLNMVLLPVLVDRIAGNESSVINNIAAFCGSGAANRTIGISSVIPLAAVVAVGSVVALFADAFVSALSDMTRTPLGRRTPWILGGAGVCAVMTLVLGSITSLPGVIVFWAVIQVGYAMLATPLAAAFAERMPDKFRERSVQWRGIGLMVGQALGVWLAAAGMTLDSYGETPFAICAVAFVLCALVPLAVWPREASSVEHAKQRFTDGVIFDQFKVSQSTPAFRAAFWSRLLMMTGAGFVTVFLWMIVRHGMIDVAQCGASSTPEAIPTAMIMAMMGLATLVGAAIAAAVAGRLADDVERRGIDERAVVICSAVVCAFALLFGLIGGAVGLLLYAFVFGLAFGLYDVFNQSLIMGVLPDPRTSGHDLGVFNVANVLAPAFAAILGAGVAVVFGWVALFVAGFVFVALSALVTVWVR
ncbi:MFS transporter [Bifidobacterium aerophilum]|uniref:MFS transporter n=1 Tax=Bifidobacterium aerophilum TaxID=1798155 RepID=A0A6N9Z7I3_9BIFI|nr:MFS transporter [Bifidobacterium aerophilum]NEG90461.1 MFS transporter [Bifidobacterium aerophilum]